MRILPSRWFSIGLRGGLAAGGAITANISNYEQRLKSHLPPATRSSRWCAVCIGCSVSHVNPRSCTCMSCRWPSLIAVGVNRVRAHMFRNAALQSLRTTIDELFATRCTVRWVNCLLVRAVANTFEVVVGYNAFEIDFKLYPAKFHSCLMSVTKFRTTIQRNTLPAI
jgi:hypothetical protein